MTKNNLMYGIQMYYWRLTVLGENVSKHSALVPALPSVKY